MSILQAFAAEVHKEAIRGIRTVDVELEQISDTEVMAYAITEDGSVCTAIAMPLPDDFTLDVMRLGLLVVARFAAEAGR